MDSSKNVLAWVLLITLSLIWGSSFILIKKGLVYLSPWEVGSLRIVAASLFLLPVALTKWKKVRKADYKYLISVGFFGSLLPAFLFAVAQTQLPSSITGILNALTPIFTIIIGMIIFQQNHPIRTFTGIAIGFVGTIFLILTGSGNSISFNAYALLIVLATIFYASNLNIIKYHLAHLHALTITSTSLVFVGPLAILYLFYQTDFSSKILVGGSTGWSIFYVILLGVMGTAIALIIFNNIVKISTPVFASSVTYFIPIVAVIWGLIDGEILLLGHYIGMAGIVLGVYIANRRGQRLKT